MKRSLRTLLAFGATAALAASLAACGPDDEQAPPSANLALADGTLQPGWSMTDLAGVDPAFLGGDSAPLPQALPMQASYDGGYDYAPAYDYAPEYDDSYYAPLDESYYEPQSASGMGDYALLALAAALAGMLGDSPPDYGFGYGGVQPWAWQTGDRYVRYAEPVRDGYRYYYYEPDSYRPFLVRDPYYSYGYRGDRLVAIYDRDGRIVDARRAERQRLAARTYYARAERMHRAAERERRFGVPAPLWERQRDQIARDRREWQWARAERREWQRWDAQNRKRYYRDWSSEALVRRDAERSFSGWQQADYRTPAPRFYNRQAREEQLRKVAELRRERAQERREDRRRAEQLAQKRQEQAERNRERVRDRTERRELAAERRDRGQWRTDRQPTLQRARFDRESAQRVNRAEARADAQRQDRRQKLVEQRNERQQRLAEEQRRKQRADAVKEQRQAQARKQEQQRRLEARRDQEKAAAQAKAREQELARERRAQAEARKAEQSRRAEAQRRAKQEQARKAEQARQQRAERQRQARKAEQAREQRAERQQQARQKARQQAAEQRRETRRQAANDRKPEKRRGGERT